MAAIIFATKIVLDNLLWILPETSESLPIVLYNLGVIDEAFHSLDRGKICCSVILISWLTLIFRPRAVDGLTTLLDYC